MPPPTSTTTGGVPPAGVWVTSGWLYRKFLLETYITQPQEGLGSFLTELASSGG